MKIKKEKTDNRKALPKFLAVILISCVVGGLLGGVAGFMGGTSLPDAVVQGIYRILCIVQPWSIWVVSAVCLGLGVWKYRKAKKLFESWNGEDEAVIELAEEQMAWVVLLTCLNTVLNFFFFGTSFQLKDPAGGSGNWLLLAFVLALIGIMLLQQKTVDLIRKMNPEKQGSIYDMKFQKKWVASCDENEQRQIGQAAFKAYNAVTYTCVFAWGALVLLGLVFDVGVLPIFLVSLIWGVGQIAYTLESIRLTRHS